jgi:hypothetical protein
MSQQFDALLNQLLRATGSSRTTLRLDWPEFGFQVNDVAGEALCRVRNPCAGRPESTSARAQMLAPVIRNDACKDGFLPTTRAPRIIGATPMSRQLRRRFGASGN